MSLRRIRTVLANPLRYSAREFLTLDDVKAKLSSYPFDVLLTRFPRFGDEQIKIVERLRLLWPEAPLITLAPCVLPSTRYQVRGIPHHKLLDDETELEDLPAVISGLLENDGNKQRLHSRNMRSGEVQIFGDEGRWKVEAEFLDFAQMGARLSVESPIPFERKMRVQICYRSSMDPTRMHRIESQVVWAGKTSSKLETWMTGARQEIGVRFIAAL